MGLGEEEDMVIRKEKKSKKKEKIDNDNGLFDEKVEEDDKKRKKRGKKKNKGSALQEVNGVWEELVLEKDYSGLNDEKNKKLKSEKREEKEKKNKGNGIREQLVGKNDTGETKVKKKMKSKSEKHVEELGRDSELDVLKKEKRQKKNKKEKDKGSSDVVCEDSNRKIHVGGEMNSESFSLSKDEKTYDNEMEMEVKKGKKKWKKEKKYESKVGAISSLEEIHNYKESKETRDSKFESIGEEKILAEVAEGSTVNGEKKETKKRKKHRNLVSDEEIDIKMHDGEGSRDDVEYCKKRKKEKSFMNDTQDCSREILSIPFDEKEDCNKGHSGSFGKKKRDREKGSFDVEMEKVDDSMRKKAKSVKDVKGKNINEGESATKNKEDKFDCLGNSEPKKPSKRVKFSKKVEFIPLSDEGLDHGKQSSKHGKNSSKHGKKRSDHGKKSSRHGKRYTKEEDYIIQNAVLDYIKEHDLGDDGLEKVLRCLHFKETKGCWKEIELCIDERTHDSIYNRAHILFERAEKRVWTPEEKEELRKFHEEYGANWRKFADEFGKNRIHTKDTWRRIRLTNRKKGPWSQDEYQKLFDLVNMDLLMKVDEEKKSKYGMLRDNIAWEAISHRLSTRTMADCCMKWYNQLESPLIREEKWANTDDIRLLIELKERDFSSEEEVDWDDLIENRSGDLCRKRWLQMVKHLGENGLKEFAHQVETLAKRYCPDVLEAREIYEKKIPVD